VFKLSPEIRVRSRTRISGTETCVVTTRPEFPRVLSRDLDAVLEEHEAHVSQLFFLPTRETTRLSEELPQVKVRRAN
jgi:hypothetical protein